MARHLHPLPRNFLQNVICLSFFAVAVALPTSELFAAAPRVVVRGSSRIQMRVSGPADQITVMGTVRDEVGKPIPKASLVLIPFAAPDVAVPWKQVHACGAAPSDSTMEHTEHPIETDEMGAFCLRAALGRGNARIRANFGGDPLHEQTSTELLWDAAQRASGLAFAPRPERIDLDAPRALFFARLAAPEDVSRRDLDITLKTETGKELATSQTDETGAVHFDVPTTSFDGPGIGRLFARFDGTPDLAAADATATVTRAARVRLEADKAEVHGDPVRGVEARLNASTLRGPVTGGAVEATLGQDVVGIAAVRDGVADLEITFQRPRDAPKVQVLVRYVSDAPYHEPYEAVTLTVVPEQPNPWLRLLPLGLGLVVAGWLLRGWRRPKRRASTPASKSAPSGVPSMAVVGSPTQRETWSGAVVDAHTGEGIGGARLRIIAPSFVDLDVIVEVTADDQGGFEFRVPSAERDLRLRVESQLHAAVERPLPPPSQLMIGLVSRRRALLERLVRWSRRAGRPWFVPPEPTPGHVVRVARGKGEPRREIAEWAARVELGAFGPEPVDELEEGEVRKMEPGRQPLR